MYRNRWVTITYEWRGSFENAAVCVRHAGGFGHRDLDTDWLAQVHQHNLGWVRAWQRGELAGWSTWHGTEGLHAIILDTVVAARVRRCGVGTR